MPSVPSRWTTTRRKPVCWLATTRTAAASGAEQARLARARSTGAACEGMLPASALCSISRSVDRFEAGCAAATDTTSGNRCSTRRVPQYWQNRTSPAFRFPQRPHLIMWKGFASSGIL